MPAITPYDRDHPTSYALGIGPAITLMEVRPACAVRLLLDQRFTHGEGIARLTALCEAHNVRIEQAPRGLKRVSGKDNTFAAVEFIKRDAVMPVTNVDHTPHIVLVNPSDQGNVGTILRSMAGFGFKDLIIVTPAADVFDPHVVRSSMGALFSCSISVVDVFETYRDRFSDYAIYPFMLDGAAALRDARADILAKNGMYSLVFGNEGTGLPPEYARLGTAVKIPQSGVIDSLNLAVAASVAMYELIR